MRLTANLLHPNSYAVRIWPDAPPGIGWAKGSYSTVCVIEPINQYECKVAPCLGILSDAVNVEIGLKCIELGFRVMHFQVEEGTKVSHRAAYQKTANGMDYYTVDLLNEAATLPKKPHLAEVEQAS